jgi:protein O-mannosyl-transferase
LKKRPAKKDQFKQFRQPGKQVTKNNYFNLIGLAIILLLGILIYSNSFNCAFHFDDISRIADNTSIRNIGDVKAWWNYYPTRPAGMFTFALNYHFNQLDVRYYHLVNLVIHLINACLVWWFTFLIFSSPSLKDNPVNRQKNAIAFFTALLFVSHPLATQSVTYIVQRFASLVAMFYLLSLVLYMKARISNNQNKRKYLLFAGSCIAAILAMLTKENAFTLPFAIVLLEIFFFRTKKLSLLIKDYRIFLLLVFFLSVFIIILLRFSSTILKSIPPSNGNDYTLTPVNYLFTQFSVILKYIQLLVLPVNQNADYDFPISNDFFGIRTFLSFMGLLFLIFLAIFFFNKNRMISFGILWFFLTISIESSFIPISDVIFEHRTYLPSVGFFLILSYGFYSLLWNKNKYLVITILVLITGSNSVLAYERNKIWKDDQTLWSDVISKSPHKVRPIVSHGYSYGELGKWENAIADYSKAIGINPNYHIAYYNRGVAYDNLEQWEKAIADYSSAIVINPKYPTAYFNRGIDYYNLGHLDKAIEDYSKAIRYNPRYSDAYSNRGIAFYNLRQLDKAIADYSMAIGINPKFANAYSNRGVAYDNQGKLDNAIADYSRALEIDPNYETAYYNRGIAYSNLGQWEKAIADYSRVIELDPKNKDASARREIARKRVSDQRSAIGDQR